MKCPEYDKRCEWATPVANLLANREFIVLLSGFMDQPACHAGRPILNRFLKPRAGLKVALSRQRKRQA
jgi:hypothetical protein